MAVPNCKTLLEKQTSKQKNELKAKDLPGLNILLLNIVALAIKFSTHKLWGTNSNHNTAVILVAFLVTFLDSTAEFLFFLMFGH
jgi:hypothetical protein